MQRPSVTLHRTIWAVFALAAAGCSAPEAEPPAAAAREPAIVARQLVAELMSVPVEQVRLISAEKKDFNDSSLGCPSPGMSYLPVITPGHVVIVEADGRRFDIRVTGDHGKVCHRRKPGAPGPPVVPEAVSEAVAAAAPCATGAPSRSARLSAPAA